MLARVTKQPSEKRLVTVDLSGFSELGTENVTSPGVATVEPVGLNVTNPAIVASGELANKAVAVWVDGGTDGQSYKVTITGIQTDAGSRLETEFWVDVRDL